MIAVFKSTRAARLAVTYSPSLAPVIITSDDSVIPLLKNLRQCDDLLFLRKSPHSVETVSERSALLDEN
jgi:hypothetical protein